MGVVGTDAAILFHCLNFSFLQLSSFSEFKREWTSFLRVHLQFTVSISFSYVAAVCSSCAVAVGNILD